MSKARFEESSVVQLCRLPLTGKGFSFFFLPSVSETAGGGRTQLIERKTPPPARSSMGLQTAHGVMTKMIDSSANPEDEASKQIEDKNGVLLLPGSTSLSADVERQRMVS